MALEKSDEALALNEKECYLYSSLKDGSVHCHACSHHCVIKSGERGRCGVRENRNATLISLVYGRVIATHVDPIEKKPLYHFYPGTTAFSIGTLGCNFSCEFCQNYDIAFPDGSVTIMGENLSPSDVVDAAEQKGCQSIAYTYNEPTIYLEMVSDTAKRAHQKGLSNIFVTNGFLTEEALDFLADDIDAMNIDLKSFTDGFYQRLCGARIAPVLETIKRAVAKGIWVEVSTLIIPGENDSEKELNDIASFLASVDPAIPWHILRFMPMYHMHETPVTPRDTLERAQTIGHENGLLYVYCGNVEAERKVRCPSCGSTDRKNNPSPTSKNDMWVCSDCGHVIHGRFRK